MTFTSDRATEQALEKFSQFDGDTKLALLWYGYLDIKDKLNPGPGASVTVPATALYDIITTHPAEQQLQVQRDIINGADTEASHSYKALASSAKLELWLLLAQGMENGSIIGVPSDYKLPAETDEFVAMIKGLEFEQRINFTRSAVQAAGTAA
ncbi:MAG TPA: orange carotenoid protein N-terminal domain-containing protein [Thermosynechococcaceae cyanobacterium]|jgi:hypothetical protein